MRCIPPGVVEADIEYGRGLPHLLGQGQHLVPVGQVTVNRYGRGGVKRVEGVLRPLPGLPVQQHPVTVRQEWAGSFPTDARGRAGDEDRFHHRRVWAKTTRKREVNLDEVTPPRCAVH